MMKKKRVRLFSTTSLVIGAWLGTFLPTISSQKMTSTDALLILIAMILSIVGFGIKNAAQKIIETIEARFPEKLEEAKQNVDS